MPDHSDVRQRSICNLAGKRGSGPPPGKSMEFKNLKADGLTTFAALLHREINNRSSMLAGALRKIEIVEAGRFGDDKPDVRLMIALAPGLEASIDESWVDDGDTLSDLIKVVAQLAESAERLFNDRHATIEMVREVRAALSKECSKGRRRGLPYRILRVSLTPCGGADDLPLVEATVEIVGSLQPLDRLVFVAETAEHVVDVFADMREQQHRLLSIRDDLARVGADVLIDAVTLAALEDAGIHPEMAIDNLRKGSGIIDIELRHGWTILYVDNGVITGKVPLGNGLIWEGGCLIVPEAYGICAKNVEGNRLDSVVSHRFLSPRLTILHASEIGNEVLLGIVSQPVALSFGERRWAA